MRALARKSQREPEAGLDRECAPNSGLRAGRVRVAPDGDVIRPTDRLNHGGGSMVTNVPDFVFNLLMWSAVVWTVLLTADRFVPILNGTTALIGFGLVVVLALLRPRYW